MVETVNRVRRAGASGPVTVRADSGFWSYRLIADLDRLGVEWSITIPQYEQVKGACIHVCVRRVLYCCGWCESWPERRVF